MSDTPETDAEILRLAETYKGTAVDAVLIHFARRLERERDALREENRKLRELGSRLNASLDSLAWLDGHETPNDAERLVMEWKQLFPELK